MRVCDVSGPMGFRGLEIWGFRAQGFGFAVNSRRPERVEGSEATDLGARSFDSRRALHAILNYAPYKP